MDKYYMRDDAPELLYQQYKESGTSESFETWVQAEILKPEFPKWLFPNYDGPVGDNELLDDLYGLFDEKLELFVKSLRNA